MIRYRRIAGLLVWSVVAMTARADLAPSTALAERDAAANWVRTHAIPLNEHGGPSETALADPRDLTGLDAAVGEARVVALGEQMHGTHEPLALRNELLAHLVEHLRFTAIAVESGVCESQLIYNFVRGASGDPVQVTRDGYSWGFGKFGENVDLIRWLRDYNRNPAHRRKINFYGIDMCGGEDAEFTHSRVAIDSVLTYLQVVDPKEASRAHLIVAPLLDRLTSQGYRQLKPAEREVLHSLLAKWTQLLKEHRETYLAAATESAYDWAKRDVIAATQIDTALAAWPLDNPPEGVSPDLYKVINIRDAAMAENVLWALDREGSSGRILLFAHNAHIMNATSLGGIWRIYREPPVAMGQHLRSALKGNLFTMATSSAQNESGFAKMVLAADGIDELLAKIPLPRYLVDLRQRAGALVTHWLESPHPLSAGFVTEHIVVPVEAYDAFVHFARLTHARPVQGSAIHASESTDSATPEP